MLHVPIRLPYSFACMNYPILPFYTNVKLHDKAVAEENFVNTFKNDLIEHEIKEQKKLLNELHLQYEEEVTKLKSMVGEAEYEAFTLLLERIRSKKFHELREKKTN